MNAVIYARYSAGPRQTDQSIDGQLRVCTDFCNSRGLKTSRGNQFNKSSINRIIKNRKYIGEYSCNGIVIEGGMPAIITPEVFSLAQAEAARRRTRRKPKSQKAEYLLSGRLFCGHCKSAMQGVSGIGGNGNKWYYYYCPNHRGRVKTCDKKQVSRDKIEKAVVDITIKYILQKDVLAKLSQKVYPAQERQSDNKNRIALYEKKLSDNKKAISNILNAIESGIATATLPARLQELEREQDVIQGELIHLKSEHSKLTEDQILFALMQYIEPKQGESTQEYRKRIITCFVSEVYAYDNRLVVYYNLSGPNGELQSSDLELLDADAFDTQSVSSIFNSCFLRLFFFCITLANICSCLPKIFIGIFEKAID